MSYFTVSSFQAYASIYFIIPLYGPQAHFHQYILCTAICSHSKKSPEILLFWKCDAFFSKSLGTTQIALTLVPVSNIPLVFPMFILLAFHLSSCSNTWLNKLLLKLSNISYFQTAFGLRILGASSNYQFCMPIFSSSHHTFRVPTCRFY